MDYSKIEKQFIEYCRITPPRVRLEKRNKCDLRLMQNKIYIETHHIVPRSIGGLDLKENLISLLPEEHIFIHKLRYKAYNLRQDMLAVRYIVNGLKNKGYIDRVTKLRLTKHIFNTYAWIKSNSTEFRYNHGWQTLTGRQSISLHRKNTMPVKEAETGKMIGSVSVDHPNVISGIWVHHSKGIKLKNNHKQLLKPQDGINNNNYKSFATEEFLLTFLHTNYDVIVCDKHFLLSKYVKLLKSYVWKHFNKKISCMIIKNRFNNTQNFINAFNKKFNDFVIFDPYYRSNDQKLKLSIKSSQYIWITNGILNRKLSKDATIPYGWIRGRT